jgi:hypothetical protein
VSPTTELDPESLLGNIAVNFARHVEGLQLAGHCPMPLAYAGRLKTQKYSVFGCRFTRPELLPSQCGAI